MQSYTNYRSFDTLLRAVVLMLACASGALLSGQSSILLLQASDVLPVQAHKPLHTVVTGLHPDAIISLHLDQVKVKLDPEVPRGVLLAALNSSGWGSFQFVQINSHRHGVNGSPPTEYPVFIHSEDPAYDHEAFDTAKRIWMLANPEAYQELLNEAAPAPSSPNDRSP